MLFDLLQKHTFFKEHTLLHITPVSNQGLCNTNYKLQTNKADYLIRVFGPTDAIDIDRKLEFNIALKAYKIGIGAKPLTLDKSNNIMICHYLDGYHKFKLKKIDIKNIAKLIKKLHSIKIDQTPFDIKKALPNNFRLTKFKQEHVLCHHDLNPKNFIFSHDIKLIDWEYARKNDRYFDLATIIIEFNLNKNDEKTLLTSYMRSYSKVDIKKMLLFKKIYLTLCIKWSKQMNNQKEKIRYLKKLLRL